jgi:sulfur relay (sulfurtransferase) DsrC/TusE family protein
MSTFKKYLKIISESNGYSEVTDTPDEITRTTKEEMDKLNDKKSYSLKEFSKEFWTEKKIKELRKEILTNMYKETGKNQEIGLIFDAGSASMATKIENLIKNKNEKNKLLELFKEKLFTNNNDINAINNDINAINIINQYNIRNISFDNIIKSIYSNSFKLEISFNSDGYEKQNQTRIKGGGGSPPAIGKKSPPKPQIYKGPEDNKNHRRESKSTGLGNYGKLFYPLKHQSQPKKKK